MLRRIFALAILAGFVLLIINLAFIRYQGMLSLMLYLIIVVAFLFYNGKNKGNKAE